jgi:hypothetical protein
MTSLPGSARALVESAALGHLVTLNPDGSPQVTVVWLGLDGDEIVVGHQSDVRFPPREDPPPGLITRIAADRVAGVGPWTAGQ